MNYEVTIGIPVFQAEDFIRRTMKSALAQTYDNIEFLIIDDCSKDRSTNIIKDMQSSCERGGDIRLIVNPANLGVSQTRNRIIEEARGDYLYFLDSDDIIPSNTIELLMGNIKKHHTEIAFGSYERIDLDGQRSIYQYPDALYETNDEFASFAYRKYFGIQASTCNFLVKTSLIRDKHLKFCNSKFWEDTIFTLELVTYIKKAVTLSAITYSYLCREGSLSDVRPKDIISKNEIIQYFKTVEELKKRKSDLICRPYYPNRCYIAIMSDIYIICNIFKRWNFISPSFTFKELKSHLNHPATFTEICSFNQGRIKNVILYIIGKLPPQLCIFSIWCMGKMKKIV